MYINKVRTEKK